MDGEMILLTILILMLGAFMGMLAGTFPLAVVYGFNAKIKDHFKPWLWANLSGAALGILFMILVLRINGH